MAKIKTMCGEHVEVNRETTTKPIVLLDLTAPLSLFVISLDSVP